MDSGVLLDLELYGGTLSQWLAAIGISVALVLLVRLAKPIVLRRLEKVSQQTSMALDDAVLHALRKTRLLLISLVAIDVGSRALSLPTNTQKIVDGVATIALFLQVGFWLGALLQFWLQRMEARTRASDPGAATSLAAVGFVGRIVLWALVLLLILDNLGINITTLVAGLGIGGIAVALAVQNILGDLFASLSIVIDKPFVVGDFIIMDDYMGTVEHIGLKTTRVRSLGGEQIIFSNSDLLKARVRNYKRMLERRIVFKFGVTYDTPPDTVEKIPALVRRLVEAHEKARFDRAHFAAFGESSLDFEVVFWMKTPDYNAYMDTQQAVNLALMRELAALKVNFAFPTRTLHTMEPLRLEARLPGNGESARAGETDKPEARGSH
jgi:small-conductance mechanosensitive channel